ncbi:MAG: ankyrin repeat domain-containing protein [Gallionella sp.]|nr:ankyrin repeat domain-containing protein [Gallionella sp.]
MQLWDQPQFASYMQDLLVSSRPGRQGFSPDGMQELLYISRLHDSCHKQKIKLPPLENPWESLPPANRTPQSYQFALQSGDMKQLRVYLTGGIPLDYHFEDGGGTPVAIAAASGQTAVVSLLIKLGAHINSTDSGRYTPLHWAAFFGHYDVAGELLKNGANIDAQQNTGSTPLVLAVIRNQTSIVDLLLKHGADKKLGGKDGTPLSIAQSKGAQDIIALLNGVARQHLYAAA